MHTQPSGAELADASAGVRSSIRGWADSGLFVPWAVAKGPLGFVLAFGFLNAVMNERYPARQPAFWYLLPSLDVVALFVGFALLGAWQKRVPRALQGTLVGLLLLARVLRLADGLELGAYYRNFNAVVDFPLLPELVRLFYGTVPHVRFALACLALLSAFVLLGFLIHRALRVAELALAAPGNVQAFAFVVGIFALASPFDWRSTREQSSLHDPEVGRRLSGAFGSSIFSRLATELNFAAHLSGFKADKLAAIARVEQQLASQALDLRTLAGRNVYLFVIESYGQSVIDRPLLAARVLPEYERFQSDLTHGGFQIASRVLDSSTYGGRSWLAHATLSTGVRTSDQFQLELLRAAQPTTLAQAFTAAGYRTVLVQPGTRRESPLRDFHHFADHYYASDFGYQGPEFGWSSMPDQFAVDWIRRRELSHPGAPLFLEYALTSSHAPWSDLPPLVEDWSALRDGAVYRQQTGVHFASSWLALDGASDAYAQSVVYDLEVLRRYLVDFVKDDSLVILLGDHQPHSEVTDGDPSAGVPVHVISRNPAFIDPFLARGYTRGMRAQTAGAHPGLETFMTDFLADFSRDSVKGKN
jgi:sulfatase-like protein